MGKSAEQEDFMGRASKAIEEALSGATRGAIVAGSLGDGKESAAKDAAERAGATYWSIDFGVAIGGGATEAQALAALAGSIARKSLHESLADPDDWGSDQEGALPRALLIAGLDALGPEAAEKALALGAKASAAGAVPVFLSSGPLDCEAPEGFSLVADGKSKSLLAIGRGAGEGIGERPDGAWESESGEEEAPAEVSRKMPGARR